MQESSITPQQIFHLYLDINMITRDGLDDIVDGIVAHRYKRIITYHRYGFVLYYFDRYCRDLLSREQFLTMGDLDGLLENQINPHSYRDEHPVYLDTITPQVVEAWKKDDLIVIDKLLYTRYDQNYGPFATQASVYPIA